MGVRNFCVYSLYSYTTRPNDTNDRLTKKSYDGALDVFTHQDNVVELSIPSAPRETRATQRRKNADKKSSRKRDLLDKWRLRDNLGSSYNGGDSADILPILNMTEDNFTSCCGLRKKVAGFAQNVENVQNMSRNWTRLQNFEELDRDEMPFVQSAAQQLVPSPLPAPVRQQHRGNTGKPSKSSFALAPMPECWVKDMDCTAQDKTIWSGGDLADIEWCSKYKENCTAPRHQSTMQRTLSEVAEFGVISMSEGLNDKYGGEIQRRDLKCDEEDDIQNLNLSPTQHVDETSGVAKRKEIKQTPIGKLPGCDEHRALPTLQNCVVKMAQVKLESRSEHRDRLTLKEVKLLFEGVENLDWTTALHHHMSCIDGRSEESIIGTPGGDLGELIVTLQAFSEYLTGPLSQKDVTNLLREYIRGSSCDRRFYHYNTEKAHTEMMANVTAEFSNLPPGFSISDPQRSFLKEAILDLATTPQFIGATHIRQLLQRPEAYYMQKGLVEKAIKAFYYVMWDKNDLVSNQITYQLVLGDHIEKGLISIEVEDGHCKSKGIVPLLQSTNCNNYKKMLVYHPSAANHFRADMAAYIANAVDNDGTLASLLDEIVDSMNSLAIRHIVKTADLIMNGYPLYSVRLHEKDENGMMDQVDDPIKPQVSPSPNPVRK